MSVFKIGRNSVFPVYEKQIIDQHGHIVDLSNALFVRLRLVQKDIMGTEYELLYDMNIKNHSNGIVEKNWEGGDTNYIGIWNAWIEVTFSNGIHVFPYDNIEKILMFEHEGSASIPPSPVVEYMKKSDYDLDNNNMVDYADTARKIIIVPTMPTTGKKGEEYFVEDIGEIVVITEDF